MALRQTTSDVEISGRKWRIAMFDPLTGSYIAMKLASKLSGIFMGIAAGKLEDPMTLVMAISQELGSLTRLEFIELQSAALSVISEVTIVGGVEAPVSIRQSGGTWAVPGLDTDMVMVLALTAHSLAWNISPFFDGNALKQVMESFKGLNLFSAST
jgi:hypothetical protein